MITATEREVLQSSRSGSQVYDSEHVSGLCCITKAALCRDILSPLSCIPRIPMCNCWSKNDERGNVFDSEGLTPKLDIYSLLLRWLHCSCAGNISRSIWSGVCQVKLKYKCETAAVKIQLMTFFS